MAARLTGGEAMSSNPGAAGGGRRPRSAEQRQGSAAMAQVMQAWEQLSDMELLTWRVAGKRRRTEGIIFFKSVNLRRLRRGEDLTRLPPQPKVVNAKPVLKSLHIRNRHGQITLKLELWRLPTEPMTVWGARPCNRGLARPDKCPRLGWLPKTAKLACDITRLYFNKHRDFLIRSQVPIVGKRIFIRLRRELDEGATLYEQVNAVVPPPEA